MSIATEISRISQNVSDSLDAVAAKGVTVPSGSTSDDLPSLIAQIQTSSGGAITITDTTDTHGGTIRTITGTVISGTKQITSNGTNIDVTSYAAIDVAVPTPTPSLQAKTNISPTESSQTIQADSGYDGLSSVQINAISSSYVGSGITRRSSTDLTASWDTVTVPAGYYSTQATKAVAAGSAGIPTATKGTVSNHAISVTPSVSNTSGYISGGNKTGTAVTVSASELVSGSETKTANGTYDVTNLAELVVSVSGTSKNTQVLQSTSRTTATSLTKVIGYMTVSKTGTYDVYWSGTRTNTSSSYTWGTRLYIDGTGYGTENTTWSNNVQSNHLTNVSLTANQKLSVYARGRGGSYYACVPMLVIVEN